MDLDVFFPDKFVIEGSTTEVRGQLSSKKNEILVHGDQNVISVEDVLVRTLTNGVVERYGVLDVMYQKGYGDDLPAVSHVKYRKEGAKLPSLSAAASHVTYNVTGSNARINVQSQDSSTNVVNVTVERLFTDLGNAISKAPLADEEKTSVLQAVQDMQAAQGTEGFGSAFQRFMSLASNCMTVVTPFLPAITQLLQ